MAARLHAWQWLCLVLVFLVQIARTDNADSSLAISTDRTSLGKGANAIHDENDLGNSKTREALAHLRHLRPNEGRYTRSEKRSGIFSTTIHYAKKVFNFLFMNGPPEDGPLAEPPRRKLSKPLAKAIELLEEAAAEQDDDAIFLLAEINFHGNYSYPRDFKRSFSLYESLATRSGNSTAQQMLGFFYSTGIGGAVERDQSKSLLYHTFAARGGNTRSEMTVAFRHHSGVGTPRNCHEAVVYYKRVADKAIAYARSGPPGGLPLIRESYHIADDDGGVYGEGASFSSSGRNAPPRGPVADLNSPVEDVMEFLDLLSRTGDLPATFGLAKVNYDGTRTVRRNFKVARKYFLQIARQYWNKEDRVISDDKASVGRIAAKAAAYLGRFYLRGEGVAQNYDKALRWFKLGVSNGDAYCQYEMGLMYLHGLGVKKDVLMAANFFKESAQQDWPAAQVNLGKLFLDQGDLKTATAYFEYALRHGHIEAFYHLAEINHFGIGRERSCDLATSYYKIVAEKAEALHSSFGDANQAYRDGDKAGALVRYMMAAEQGYEHAQANVAYLLDEHKSILSLDRFLPWKQPTSVLLRNAVMSLVYYTRSAKQFNIDSTVKMGDYYLNGWGSSLDVDKAAQCYQSAAEMHQSAQALWNLGWMHENGLGVDQDFHLAHRLYLEAADANSESYLPVKLSILKLRVRSWWSQMTDGKVNPIQPEPAEENAPKTWADFFAQFLSAAATDANPDAHGGGSEDASGAYGDRDGIGEEYYLDDMDGAALEAVTMLVLAAALAFLVYYRQMRQQVNARAVAERDRRTREDVDGREVWGDGGVGTGGGVEGDGPLAPGDHGLADGGARPAGGMGGLGPDEWVDIGVGGVGH